jgi:hypothetical protein
MALVTAQAQKAAINATGAATPIALQILTASTICAPSLPPPPISGTATPKKTGRSETDENRGESLRTYLVETCQRYADDDSCDGPDTHAAEDPHNNLPTIAASQWILMLPPVSFCSPES